MLANGLPVPLPAHEQLDHLYHFSNTPRTLDAGRRLQELSGLMNPCSYGIDKNMAHGWEGESRGKQVRGAQPGLPDPQVFDMPKMQKGRPATPLTDTCLVAPSLMVPEIIFQTPVGERVTNEEINFHCCSLDTIGREDWDEDWGAIGEAARRADGASADADSAREGSVLDDGEIRQLLSEMGQPQAGPDSAGGAHRSILEDPDLQELLPKPKPQPTKPRAQQQPEEQAVGRPQQGGLTEKEIRASAGRLLSGSSAAVSAAAAAVPELQTSFLRKQGGAQSSARQRASSRGNSGYMSRSGSASFLAQVSARSDVAAAIFAGSLRPRTPDGLPSASSAARDRPPVNDLGTVSSRAHEFRQAQFQSSNQVSMPLQ